MKIYENSMRFTDFRRNYCAPGNLSCKVWYLFPVVICCPFFSSHHALFIVVLVGEPNSADILHQQEETIQMENPPKKACLRDTVWNEFNLFFHTSGAFILKLNFCNLAPAKNKKLKKRKKTSDFIIIAMWSKSTLVLCLLCYTNPFLKTSRKLCAIPFPWKSERNTKPYAKCMFPFFCWEVETAEYIPRWALPCTLRIQTNHKHQPGCFC